MTRRALSAALLATLLFSNVLVARAAPPTATSFATTASTVGSTMIQLQGADPDGTPLTFAVGSGPASGALSGLNASTGTVVYTPAAGFTGTTSFTYTVASGGDTTSAATVTITVTSAKTKIIDTFLNADGTPRSGKVTFILTQPVTSPAGLIAASSTVSATLNSSGTFSVSVYPSRALSPQSYYQVWYEAAGGLSRELMGVYDIPASASTITLSGNKVTDTNLAARYVFASLAQVESLRSATASATIVDLLAGSHTNDRLQKWSSGGFVDTSVSEAGGTLSVGENLIVTGTASTGAQTVNGAQVVHGNQTVNGNQSVTGSQTVAGSVTAGSYVGITSAALPLTLSDKVIADPIIENPTINGPSAQNGDAVITGSLTASGTVSAAALAGNCAACTNLSNSALPATIDGKVIANPIITNPTTNGPSAQNGDPSITGNVTVTGNVSASGDVTAGRYFGNGANLTGITGATGGLSNPATTTVGADTDNNGTGKIAFQTRNTDRVLIENDGALTGTSVEQRVGSKSVYEYGAKGDGTTNDSAAIQAALTANAAGGEVVLPAGSFRISTAVLASFGSSQSANLVVRGQGGKTRLLIDVADGQTAIRIVGAFGFSLKNLVILPFDPGDINTAFEGLKLEGVKQALLENVHFFGVQTIETNGAALRLDQTDAVLRNVSFRGCGATVANGSNIRNTSTRGLHLDNVAFIDFGNFAGQNYVINSAPLAWVLFESVLNGSVHAGSVAPISDADVQVKAVLRNVRMDEGAVSSVVSTIPDGATELYDLELDNVHANVSGVDGAAGLNLIHVTNVTVRDSWFGYRAGGSSASCILINKVQKLFASNTTCDNKADDINLGPLVTYARLDNVRHTSLTYDAGATRVDRINATSRGYGVAAPTSTLHVRGTFRAEGMTKPVISSVTQPGGSGSTSYTYYVVAVNSSGQRSEVSAGVTTSTGPATLNGTAFNQVQWAAIPGAVSYHLLRNGTTNSLVTTVLPEAGNPTVSGFDQGETLQTYAPPTHNETADIALDGQLDATGGIRLRPFTFASLPAAADGTILFCPDCTEADPCAGGGTGAFAKRRNAAWKCN